jgi:hypothetical protein
MDIDTGKEVFYLTPSELVALNMTPDNNCWQFQDAEALLRAAEDARHLAGGIDPSAYIGSQQQAAKRRKQVIEQAAATIITQLVPYVSKQTGDEAEQFLKGQ